MPTAFQAGSPDLGRIVRTNGRAWPAVGAAERGADSAARWYVLSVLGACLRLPARDERGEGRGALPLN